MLTRRMVLTCFLLLGGVLIGLALWGDQEKIIAREKEDTAYISDLAGTIIGLPDISGPAPFRDAIRDSLELLFYSAPVDFEFVTGQISLFAFDETGELREAIVTVKTKTLRFPSRDYTMYDRAVLADSIIREATHVWLYENNYDYTGKEAQKYGIEQKVQAYIPLN